MGVNIGPKIGIDGEAEYRKNIQNIIQQQKTLNSEMQKVAATFSKDSEQKKKNAAQTEILNKQIANQKERIGQLTEMYKQSVSKTGENSTSTLKWKQALSEAETELKKMQDTLQKTDPNNLTNKLNFASKKIGEVSTKISSVGDTMTKNVSLPLAALGGTALAAFKKLDAGSDIIVQKTGASGKSLKEMQNSMKEIASTIPTSFEQAGAAVGEVNTRFGVTGKELTDLSSKFVKFSKLNGTEVSSSIDNVQKAMAAYGLKAKDAGAFLDTLNKVGQDTGINVDTLAQSLTTNGAALRKLGLNAASSAALIGKLEKSGIDASTVFTGMSKLQIKAIKDGKSMQETLKTALSSSKNAMEAFGKRAGPQLYEAFSTGKLSVDMFAGSTTSLKDNLGNVSETFKNTQDPIDSWKTTLNNLTVVGAELGASIGTVVGPMIKQVGDEAKKVANWFNGLNNQQKDMVVKFGLVAIAAGPVVSAIGKVGSGISVGISVTGKLIAGFQSLGGVAGILGKGIGFLASPFGIATLAIGAIITAGVLLYKNWDKIKETARNLWSGITNTWKNIKTSTQNTWNGITNSIKGFIDKIKGFFNFKWAWPRLKMPHFSIQNGSLNPLDWIKHGVPKIGIQWYAKAYDNAVEFDRPTVLATTAGLKGFGDGNGSEIVIGKNTLLNTIQQAVRNVRSSEKIVVNVYPSQGMDERQVAKLVIDEISHIAEREREVYG